MLGRRGGGGGGGGFASAGGIVPTSGGAAPSGQATANVDNQTGTSYTIPDSDRAQLLTISNASAVAITLPQAGASSLFLGGWYCWIQNRGAGTVTITPTTSTIDGASSFVLKTDQGIGIFSDGTNYWTERGCPDVATTSKAGIVTPDGTTITISGSTISVPTATTSTLGLVKPDGTTIDVSAGVISVPTATTSVLGLVKPDGSTITIAAGVISASGGGGGGSGALTLLGTYNASNSSELDIVTRNASGQSGAIFQSDFDTYKVEIINFIPATNGVNLLLQASTNGGSSYDTASHYDWVAWFTVNNAAATQGSGSSTSIALAQSIPNAANDNGGVCASMTIFGPLSTSIYTRFHVDQASCASVNNALRLATQPGSGRYFQSSAVNAFRVLMSSGNISSGSLRVYGVSH